MAHQLRREDATFVARAPLVNDAHVDLDLTPDEIWPALAEAEAWEHWFDAVRESRYHAPGPPGLGSLRHVVVQRLEVDEEIVVYEPGARFGFSVLSANRKGFEAMVEVVTLEPHDGGTRVTYRQAIETARWLRPLLPLLRRSLRRELRAGLAGLGPYVSARRAQRASR